MLPPKHQKTVCLSSAGVSQKRVAAPSNPVALGHEQMHQNRHLHIECTRAACGVKKRHLEECL